MPENRNISLHPRTAAIAFACGLVLLLLVPTGFLRAQQLNINDSGFGNSSKINAHVNFVRAGEVSVASKVYVEKVPNSDSNQVFVRIHGRAKNHDSLVVTCGVVSSGNITAPCNESKNGKYAEARFVTGEQVLFQRLNFEENPKGKKEIAIEFFYL